MRSAANTAISDSWTLVPLVGAGIFSLGDLDEDVSDWARRETVVFGSNEAARDFSNVFLFSSYAALSVTAAFAPSGESFEQAIGPKLKGMGTEGSAVGITLLTTGVLKYAINRTRPDGEGDKSFPSGHSAQAFVTTGLASRNLDYLDLSLSEKTFIRVGLAGIASATAWGRVESGKHHPSDVLFGAALGNFFAVFVHDAFLGLGPEVRVNASLDPFDGAYLVGVTWSF